MSTLLWMLVAWAGVSFQQATPEQASDVGKAWIAAVQDDDLAGFMELMDTQAALEIATDLSKLPPGFVEGFAFGADASERGIFQAQRQVATGGGSFRQLAVVEKDGANWVHLGVIYGDHVMFNQVRLRVGVTGAGPRVVDMWVLSTGRAVSDGLRENVSALVGAQGMDPKALARLQATKPLVKLSSEGRWRELVTAHGKLPEDARKHRMVMVLMINAARALQDVDLLLRSIDAFLAEHPDDGAAYMFRLEKAMQSAKGAGDAMLALEKDVGPDAFMRVQAAAQLLDEGRIDDAVKAANSAVELEPGLAEVAFVRLFILAARPDPSPVAAALADVDKRFGLNVEVLEQDPDMVGLVKHPGFEMWRKQRQ